MRKIWDFPGGVHPPDNKHQSTQHAIKTAPIPSQLVLPLSQHAGQPAKPVVETGEYVLKGQLIASAEGFVSAAIHAPTSGKISAIEKRPVADPSGLPEMCIVLQSDQQDRWCELNAQEDYRVLEPQTINAQLQGKGIVGLGGAGFPTSVKLMPSADMAINTLIINAAECEPYITADDMLMREKAEQIIQGCLILMKVLSVEECLIGIEKNKSEAAAMLTHQIIEQKVEHKIQLGLIPTKYPSGGEKQLIQLLTGMEVPNGGIPAEIGIVCVNVGTTFAIYEATVLGRPLVSRVVTFTGAALGKPGNYRVLVGTSIAELLQLCEFNPDAAFRLVLGGPMMGFTLTNTDTPVTKTTNCILAATRKELPPVAQEKPCIRCGICEAACPASLLPQQLYWFSKADEFDKALSHNLLDCIECGACAYVCPSDIPLVQYYRYAKGKVREQEHEHTQSEFARQRFEARQTRLEAEQQEKAARRAARAKTVAAKNTSTDDSKVAVIEAALQRAKAKKSAQHSAIKIDNNTDTNE